MCPHSDPHTADSPRGLTRIFQSVVRDLTDGVVAADRNGQFLVWNPAAERILGKPALDIPPDQWPRTYGCYLPDKITLFPVGQLPMAKAMEGKTVTDVEMFIRNEKVPNGVLLSINASPLRDKEGKRIGGVIVFRDITASRETEEAVRRLSNAVEQTADSVVITDKSGRIEYVNPAFQETTGYTLDEAIGRTPRILKSGQHDTELYRSIWKTILSGKPFRGTLINRKKSGDLYQAEQTITPMKDLHGRVSHFVSVMKDLTEVRKREEQEREMQMARVVQRRLFPSSSPSLEQFDISGAAFSAGHLCGDCFDYVPMLDDTLGIVVGDVCGHGLGPALLMAEVRAYVRAYAKLQADVEEILRLINNDIMTDLAERIFVTMILLRLDPKERTFVYASAGHPPGFLFNRSGELKMELESTGTPLGLFSGARFPCTRPVSLEPGDLLVLATDGLTECEREDGRYFDKQGLLDAVRVHHKKPADEIVRGLYDSACSFASGRVPADDVTLIVCRAPD